MEPSKKPGPRNWTARVIAPLALLATVAATVALVAGSLGDNGGDDGKNGRASRNKKEQECNPPADAALAAGFYIIKEGEPGLSAVAERTCMTIKRLERLNPELDPQAIAVGQCVNLRRNGCENAG